MSQNHSPLFSELFVAIAASNWDKVVTFYQTLLAQEPQGCRPGVYYAEFVCHGWKLGIFKPKAENQAEFTLPPGALSLCLEVENLEQAIALIGQLGGTIANQITEASHGRECYAYDPANNRLILHQASQKNKLAA